MTDRLLFIALIGLTACAPDTGTMTLANRIDAIRGGQNDNQTTAVVGILFQENGQQGLCSGSLIAPNLVMTAQHCVAQIRSPQVICGQSQFGNLYSPQSFFVTTDSQVRQGGRFYGVRDVQVPQLFADNCGFDIAVLILDQSIPANEATPLIPRLDDFPQPGERFSAVGYGHVGNGSGSGTRRRIDNRQILCAGPNCAGNDGITGTELVGNDGTCQGDSGGPALDSQNRVLGALSRGGDGCVYPVYAAAAAWSDWLKARALEAADIGGYGAPVWADPPNAPPPEPEPEPEVQDADRDGIPDDVDNCPGAPNAGQGDLDADGLGDDCDQQLDRECSVCAACQDHGDCGPGAYCDGNGFCFMECRTDDDCPGGDSTTCAQFDGFAVCVNADREQAGLCHARFECGVASGPPTEEPPVGEPPPVEEPPVEEPPVEGGDPPPFEKPSEDPAQPPPALLAPGVGRASYSGGCDTSDGAPTPAWAGLLFLAVLRRRRA